MPLQRPHALVFLACVPALAHAAPGEGSIEPSLQLQTWVTAFDQDESAQADPASYGDPEHDMGFSVQRARVGFSGETGAIDYHVSVGTTAPYDAISPQGPLIDLVAAYGRYTREVGPGELRMAIGTRPVPFSRERMLSSTNLTFQERGVAAQWQAPTWGMGATTEYTLPAGLRATLGLFNGNANVWSDDNDGLTMAGRVEWQNADSYDLRATEPGTYGVGVATLYDMGLATDTFGVAGDAFARVGPIQFVAEGSRVLLTPGATTVDQPTVTDPTVRYGAQGQLSYIADMEQGRTEIAARFAWFDDRAGVADNGDVGVVHAGLTRWDLIPGLDVGAGYVHRLEMGGRSFPNNTARLWVQLRYPHPQGTPAVMP
jgi:hypothetical protein